MWNKFVLLDICEKTRAQRRRTGDMITPTRRTTRSVCREWEIDAGRCTGPFSSKLFFSVLSVARMLSAALE